MPNLCRDSKAQASKMGEAALSAALKSIELSGKSLIQYTKDLNIAAGYTDKGLYL